MFYFGLVLVLLSAFIWISEDISSTVKTLVISSLFIFSIFAFCSFVTEEQNFVAKTLVENGFRPLSDEEVYHSSRADLDKLTKIGAKYYVLDDNNNNK